MCHTEKSSNFAKFVRRLGSIVPSNWLRRQVLRAGGVRIGEGTVIPRGIRIGHDVAIGRSVRVSEHCVIYGGVRIGDHSNIGEAARIGPNVKTGEKVTIGSNTFVANLLIGNNSFIESGVRFTGFQDGRIKIGKQSYIGTYGVLDWSGGIEIGDYVHIAGPSVGVWTHTSVFQALSGDELSNHKHKKVAAIKIEDYVYVGGNSTIYPGVKIGNHSVVLPNTAVNKDVEEHTMVGGSPAAVKRRIKTTNGEIEFNKPA
jgi:acetyltransferase-like isoleucine patch superfamily enzyme